MKNLTALVRSVYTIWDWTNYVLDTPPGLIGLRPYERYIPGGFVLPNSGILLPSLGNCYATTVPSITEQGEKWNELEATIWDVKMCEIYNQWNFISGLSIGAFMGMVFGIIIEKLFARWK